MTIVELMARLAGIGATVGADGDRVAVRFPEEHRREVQRLGLEIQRLKPELLRALPRQSGQAHFVEPENVFLQSLVDHSDLEDVSTTSVPEQCPPLPAGVRVVRYAPKIPPVAVAPVSIVTDVDKFIRVYLRDLGHRLQHPRSHACASLSEILTKLAEVGLELAIEPQLAGPDGQTQGGTACEV